MMNAFLDVVVNYGDILLPSRLGSVRAAED